MPDSIRDPLQTARKQKRREDDAEYRLSLRRSEELPRKEWAEHKATEEAYAAPVPIVLSLGVDHAIDTGLVEANTSTTSGERSDAETRARHDFPLFRSVGGRADTTSYGSLATRPQRNMRTWSEPVGHGCAPSGMGSCDREQVVTFPDIRAVFGVDCLRYQLPSVPRAPIAQSSALSYPRRRFQRMSTSGSRSSRPLFIVGLWALFLGLMAPIAPAFAAEEFSTVPQAWINDNSPIVGEEVFAELYPASVPAADSYTYQWYTVEGTDPAVPISGATSETYTVTAGDAGLALQVRVTASKAGYNDASDMSYATDPVMFDFTSGPQVSIDDTTPTVDQKVSAVLDSPTVPAGTTYSYQWYWIVAGNPTSPIYGATDDEYTVSDMAAGNALQVQVTATKGNYNDASDMSDRTALVAKADFSSSPTVTITGTPKVGELLTANVSGVTPEPNWYTYEWKANGVHINNGYASPTYTLTKYEADEKITVTVTAVRSGYNTTQEVTSAPTANVARFDFTKPPTVTITGTPKVGALLWAVPTGESPAADDYIYVWKAGGTEIGAYSQGFSPTAAELGKTITVTVEATKLDYNPSAVAESNPTAVVAKGTFSRDPTANLSTTAPQVGSVLKVTPTGAVPAADSYAYQWYKISLAGVKTPITGATSSEYAVPSGALNYKLQAKITAVKEGYISRWDASAQTARVNWISLSKASVTRGQTITVSAKKMRAGQVYRIFIDGKRVYKGRASSTGTVVRTVTVPTSIGTGTKKVWVSGYSSSGVRDFKVLTTVLVN